MANYLRAVTMEVTALARACGKSDVHHLEPEDLVALTVEAAAMARVPLAGTGWIPGWPDLTAVPALRSAEVVVIGGGVAGLSTARALVELGVTDVLVLERAAVGSGGTGKSSGIVRCHYGIPSLAAMAWHALPVLETRPRSSARRRATATPATWSASGPRTSVRSGPTWPCSGRSASRSSWSATTTAQELWPAARLDDFAEFAYEPRGGYGDGHQTALAFAVAARRGGARLRQHRGVAALETTGDRVAGVRLVDGDRVGAAHVVLAAGPWSAALAAPLGVDLPVRAQRAQILLVDPGRPLGPVPVFSDLVSLQYVRTEGAATLLVGDSDHSNPEWADPDDYRERAGDEELAALVPKFEPPLPRPRRRRAVVLLRRLLRRHARLQPGHLGRPRRGALALRRVLRARLQDLARRSASSWPTSSSHGAEPPRRRRPPRLPLGALRRGGPPGQPAPLRRSRPDALSRGSPLPPADAGID